MEMDEDCLYCLHDLTTKNSYNERLHISSYGLAVIYNWCTQSISSSMMASVNNSSMDGTPAL